MLPNIVNISTLPSWMRGAGVQKLISEFTKKNVPFRFVGGCVRDTLLGRDVKDIDICTPLMPDEVIQLLSDCGIKSIPTGVKHGTITAIISGLGNDHSNINNFEITTLRKDENCYGRHADVSFTDSWEEDSKRRDFTFNALYMDINGTIYDYHNGISDLENEVIRFIGDAEERMSEDYLRILRYFRFMATHNMQHVDLKTIYIIRDISSNLTSISGERIAAEMMKLLASDNAERALKMMQKSGVIEYILGIDSYKYIHIDNENPIIRLALLLRSSTNENQQENKNKAQLIGERWKLSGIDRKFLEALCVTDISVEVATNEHKTKKIIRRYGNNLAASMAMLLKAETGNNVYDAFIEMCQKWQSPLFPVLGKDLLSIGHSSGRMMGDTLRNLENKWEDSGYKLTKEELISMADNHIKR